MLGVVFEMLLFVVKIVKFDLMLNLEEGFFGLEGMIEYNIDLFDCEIVYWMVNYFE